MLRHAVIAADGQQRAWPIVVNVGQIEVDAQFDRAEERG